MDRPAESGGCDRRPLVRPGTTAQLTVLVPPAAAAGTRRRSYLLHVPAHYASGHLTPWYSRFTVVADSRRNGAV